MPPSCLPRLPCEEEDPEPYSLIVVVCSGKIQLQHKASCYHGHDYSNRLNSLQGCTTIQPARSDLQGGRNLVRERSTKATRHGAAHPRLNREVIRRTISYALRGLGPSPFHAPARSESGRRSKKQIRIHRPDEDTPHPGNQAAVLLTFEELSNELRRSGAHNSLSHVK